MLMQMEDLQNKMKDIQFMKVTREIQLVCQGHLQSSQSVMGQIRTGNHNKNLHKKENTKTICKTS